MGVEGPAEHIARPSAGQQVTPALQKQERCFSEVVGPGSPPRSPRSLGRRPGLPQYLHVKQFAPLESASPSSAAWPLPDAAATWVLLPCPHLGPSLSSREPLAMHGTRRSLRSRLSAGM